MDERRPLVLLDTNVWVDYYSSPREGHDAARSLMDGVECAGAQLLYAIQSMKDVFYLVASDYKSWTRKRTGTLTEAQAAAATATAWGCLDNMAEIACAVGCDQSDVWLARKTRRLHADFEDDLVLAAAQRAGADLLVTSDEQLRRHAPVAALSVPDALTYLQTLDATTGPGTGLV